MVKIACASPGIESLRAKEKAFSCATDEGLLSVVLVLHPVRKSNPKPMIIGIKWFIVLFLCYKMISKFVCSEKNYYLCSPNQNKFFSVCYLLLKYRI
jgi:hypothetical protein